MDARAVLWGGPLDGVDIAPRALPFIFVSRSGSSARVHTERAPTRVLYAFDEKERRFVFAGYTHAVCESCDTVQTKAEACLCGGKLTRG